jgi:hypothetical protein
MINSRTDYFKVYCGPFIKAIEDLVYQNDHFIKHIPVPDRWKRVAELKRGYKYYYSTDYTAFESHFTSKQMSNIECSAYRRCFDHYRKDCAFICKVLTGMNRCRTRTGLRCRIKGKRMSGDMNTSLGNGLSNMFLIQYLMAASGVSAGSYDFLVEGDDAIIASNVELKAKQFEELGFTIKIERVADPCEASFCGLIFTDKGTNIRDPVRFFEKFGWTHSSVLAGEAVMMQLLKAKCLSALYETPHCPLVSAAAFYCLKKCGAVVPRFDDIDTYHMGLLDFKNLEKFGPEYPVPQTDVRQLFADVFGIPVSSQVYCEERIMEGDFDCLQVLPFSNDLVDYTLKFVACC